MDYEARHAKGLNFLLAGAVLLLSLLGFVAAGTIPTESTRVGGTYPLVGWAIVIACFAAAALFVKRGLDTSVQARIDAAGVWSRRNGGEQVPWSDIQSFHVLRAGIQRIARFGRAGGKDFGINTTFYDRGVDALAAAVRHHRPDLDS
jgi:hypothetical protein